MIDHFFKELIEKKESKIIIADAMEILQHIPSSSIDCIITSPPYWGLRDYGINNQIGLEALLEDYFLKLINIFNELNRILKDQGTLWLNIGDSYTSGNRKYRATDHKCAARSMGYRPDNPKGLKNKDLIGIPWRLAIKLQESGWYLRSDIIWHKPNAMPESVKDRPYKNHEYLFLFSKSEKYFFDNDGLVKDNNKKRRTVWTVNHPGYNGKHYATFPKELIEPCVLCSTKKHQLILDPFFGIGTVGSICEVHNRNYIGIEVNPEFAKISSERLKATIKNYQQN